MTHADFTSALKDGSLRAHMPPQAASEYISRRLMLPFFMMPLLGAGVGLALIGWLFTGLLVFLVGFIIPRLVKRNAIDMLMRQAAQDEAVYADLVAARVLQIEQP